MAKRTKKMEPKSLTEILSYVEWFVNDTDTYHEFLEEKGQTATEGVRILRAVSQLQEALAISNQDFMVTETHTYVMQQEERDHKGEAIVPVEGLTFGFVKDEKKPD